ncbi:MAG: selenoprotein O, partial [Alphaproteobacteria bacterium]
MLFTPQHAIDELGDEFADPVSPAAFPETILRFRNQRAAAEIGLDALSDAEWLA